MVFALHINAQLISFEKDSNATATYEECIDFYKKMDKKYNEIKMMEVGSTDAGYPLHVVYIDHDATFSVEQWHKENKIIILINNGIHPGEPDGIDASMLLTKACIEKNILPSNVVLAIIPVFNIGGCIDRSAFHRVDQNGPQAFGSRGNAQNLDLNRDFIKCDARETRSLCALFQKLKPHIFIDNHVSDGADYQHTMTLIATQYEQLGGKMGAFLKKEFEPFLYQRMDNDGYPMIPYCNVWGKSPENGWQQFFDSPRYASGYASMFHILSFVAETHILKPYHDRVNATLLLMKNMIYAASTYSDKIIKYKKQDVEYMIQTDTLYFQWEIDTTQYDLINYMGYTYEDTTSGVSGLKVKHYNREKPFTKKIPFYNHYKPKHTIQKPIAYIVPQAWWRVIELLKLNNVKMIPIDNELCLQVEQYKIENIKSSDKAYEAHHANTQVNVSKENASIVARKGDYIIEMNQYNNKFIAQVLEPLSGDNYMTWNFFDAILVQKEGYNDYVFEKKAVEILALYPQIKVALENKRKSDTAFANNASAQLDFVFRNSPYYEKAHNVYPIYRVMDKNELDVNHNYKSEMYYNKKEE